MLRCQKWFGHLTAPRPHALICWRFGGTAALVAFTACGGGEHPHVVLRDSTPRPGVISILPDSSFTAPDSGVASPDSPLVLFALEFNGRQGFWMNPVAIYDHDSLLHPPVGDESDSAANAFRGAFYGRNQRYRVFSGGEEIGLALAGKAEEPACSGLGADAVATLKVRIGTSQDWLATNSRTARSRTGIRRPLTTAEQDTLYRLIATVLADSGVSPRLRGSPSAVKGSGIAVPGHGWELAGSLRTDSTDENDFDFIISVFVVADSARSTYRLKVVSFHQGSEADLETEEFLDVINLTGDSTFDLVTENGFYESHAYSVYRQTVGGWRKVYMGGGGGC